MGRDICAVAANVVNSAEEGKFICQDYENGIYHICSSEFHREGDTNAFKNTKWRVVAKSYFVRTPLWQQF
jgi:hypothetical protein